MLMRERRRDLTRHQSAPRREVRSLPELRPPARRLSRRRCNKLSRVPHRIDRASERSRAGAGRSGRRGSCAAANPSLATIRQPSLLWLLEAARLPQPTSSRAAACEASRTLVGRSPQRTLQPRFDPTPRTLAVDSPLRAVALRRWGDFGVVIRIDGDRLCSGGRQPKGIGLAVLLVAPPGRHSRLGLDLLDQASRDQLRRDLMSRGAF